MAETWIGKPVPGMKLPASDGKQVALTDFKGKNIVLYFYPKDMTRGCTTEACDFRDHHDPFQQLDSVVIGVSPDDLQSHEEFIAKHDLPFLLLADTDKTLAKEFGVWKLREKDGKEFMGIERATFVINKDGRVVQEWTKVDVADHVKEVRAYIEENLQ